MNQNPTNTPSPFVEQQKVLSPKLYQGIDLANSTKNIGHCIITDDDEVLTVQSIGQDAIVPVDRLTRRALDCHFGYPAEIIRLLRGSVPSDEAQRSKQFALWRRTEDWFADAQFPSYQTRNAWDARNKAT